MTNRAGLAQALAAVTSNGEEDVHLNLSGLEFMHVDGLRLLVETAATLPDGRYLVLDAVPPHLRRIIGLVGWDRTPGLKLGAGAAAARERLAAQDQQH
jgi:anti-anti-sigma regulatory factor